MVVTYERLVAEKVMVRSLIPSPIVSRAIVAGVLANAFCAIVVTPLPVLSPPISMLDNKVLPKKAFDWICRTLSGINTPANPEA